MKKLVALAVVLMLALAVAVPAFAQDSAQTNADQALDGDTTVSPVSSGEQGDFEQTSEQTQEIDGGDGAALGVQNSIPVGIQAEVPVSVGANLQQLPVSLVADLELILELLLGL